MSSTHYLMTTASSYNENKTMKMAYNYLVYRHVSPLMPNSSFLSIKHLPMR